MIRSERLSIAILLLTLAGVSLAIWTADSGTPGPAYVIKRALLAAFGS